MKRVFLVGYPRSGTTLLQSMLAAHPSVISFPETHFFSIAYPSNKLRRLLMWPALNLSIKQKFINEKLKGMIDSECMDLQFSINPFSSDYASRFVCLLDGIALRNQKSVWVEKTPRHLHMIDKIKIHFPDAKFIHILRNGLDAVASLYLVTNNESKNWGELSVLRKFNGFTLEYCINRWLSDVAITKRFLGDPDHCIVKYENLVNVSSSELARICQFLQIDYDANMLEYRKVSDRLITKNESWKLNNSKELMNVSGVNLSKLKPEERCAIKNSITEINWV